MNVRRFNLLERSCAIWALTLLTALPLFARSAKHARIPTPYVWARTNGIDLGFRILRWDGGLALAADFRTKSPHGTNVQQTTNARGGALSQQFRYLKSDNYFMPTNCAWGPMRLTDTNGASVALLDPSLNSPGTYPQTLAITLSSFILRPSGPIRSGESLPRALRTGEGVPVLRLNQFFGPLRPGEYRLTISPKVYVREGAASDIARRLDFPPVVIDFADLVGKPRDVDNPAGQQ